MYTIEIPNIDDFDRNIIVNKFSTESEAIYFCDKYLGCQSGYYSLMSFDGEYYSCDLPNPDYIKHPNQFLVIEEFVHEQDCLDFIYANFPDVNPNDKEVLINLVHQRLTT